MRRPADRFALSATHGAASFPARKADPICCLAAVVNSPEPHRWQSGQTENKSGCIQKLHRRSISTGIAAHVENGDFADRVVPLTGVPAKLIERTPADVSENISPDFRRAVRYPGLARL